MSRVVIIGGSGHVGTYLVPRLVETGHEVVNVTRGKRAPYQANAAWRSVETVVLDRAEAEKAGTFADAIRDLKPDIVVDMICFLPESAEQLAGALSGQVRHLVHVGTIWVHGPSVVVPAPETQTRRPFGDYGTRKAAIETFLMDAAQRGDLPVTIVHPGHIVGPGWNPLNPAGHFNPEVFTTLAQGRELALANFGMETVHHVHADDVAQMIMKALANWSAAVGEAFHTVSPGAISLRGYAEAVAGWFGKDAALTFLPWEEWKAKQNPDEARATWEHISRSPNASIEKARRLLGYAPRYTSLEAVREAVDWLIAKGVVKTE